MPRQQFADARQKSGTAVSVGRAAEVRHKWEPVAGDRDLPGAINGPLLLVNVEDEVLLPSIRGIFDVALTTSM